MRRVSIKYLLVCVIIILSLFLWTSCRLPDIDISPPPSPAPSQTTAPIEPDWRLPVESQARPLLDFAEVVARVKPSVVAINTEVIGYDIFSRPLKQERAGSGWIIDKDGLIITNAHVVREATTITVTLDDGRTFAAKEVRTDPLTDLAVIKIDATNLPAATIGDSTKLRVGELVAAIGNPLGLGISMKGGWVSRLGVSITVSSGQTLYNLIETDAAINPGNSGGPLVNMAGEVIGITSAKIAMVGVEGMGYAISTQVAMPVIEQLIKTGYVIRPWLGVVLHPTYNQGALVTEVALGSPADKAGIKPGDVIVELNGQEITTAQQLIQAIHSSQINQRVKITFWRGATKNTTYATLIESPPPKSS